MYNVQIIIVIYIDCISNDNVTEKGMILDEKKLKIKNKVFSLEASLSRKSISNIHRVRIHLTLV